MEFKGTKNWETKEKEDGFYLSGQGWEDFAVVNKITDGSDPLEIFNDQSKANAKLISCAPELLQMIKEFEVDLRHGYVINKNRLNRIQALISKATTI